MANRLAFATSPYLKQHADNPVDWWEWEPAAFEEARLRDVPVLLSVGYAACHWCHVMAHESFEDEATAAQMNRDFVNIKVDREERPDVDAVYMQATTALTGSGGWPMTVVLDHDAQPFFAGTYFPDRPRHGQPSFSQILSAIAQAWQERRAEVDGAAARIGEALRAGLHQISGPDNLDAEVIGRAVGLLRTEYDAEAGGFGRAPKFPPTMVAEFLRRVGASDMVDHTLDAMARGGLYDQLGGGFARYSVDRDWVVPHFEKMLYDNALMLALYARWGGDLGRRVARETADFLMRELRTGEGGFASALDADSEGAEGTFYVWSPSQLADVLDEDGGWAAALLGVTGAGTFEHGFSTLQLRRDPDDPARWQRVRERLLAAREHRVRPDRVDLVVAAWNGLAISALVAAARALRAPDLLAAARQCADFLWQTHMVDGRLRRASIDGIVGAAAGVLEDYGCLAAGFLDLAAATAEADWITRAEILFDAAQEHFYAGEGRWFDTADDAEALVARPSDAADNASPSGTSAMVHALLAYAAITGSGAHRDLAERTLAALSPLMSQSPRFAGWSLAAMATLDAPEIAIVGPQGQQRDDLERLALASPGATVVVSHDAVDAIALLRDRPAAGGAPTAYVCRGHVCQRPVTSTEDLVAMLRAE